MDGAIAACFGLTLFALGSLAFIMVLAMPETFIDPVKATIFGIKSLTK